MPNIRHAKLAGSWYPGDKERCRDEIESYLDSKYKFESERPRLAILPHAGWAYCGSLLAIGYRELAQSLNDIDTLILFYGHLRPNDSIRMMHRSTIETPLGSIATDDELAAAIFAHEHDFEIIEEEGDNHRQDNSAEIHFPWIKYFFPEQKIIPIAMPPNLQALTLIDTIVDQASGLNRRLAFIGSTDLTHYGPNFGFSPQGIGEQAESWVRQENDRRWIEYAAQFDSAQMITESLAHFNACCAGSAAAAVEGAKRYEKKEAKLLAYATSSDIRPATSFVGYATLVS